MEARISATYDLQVSRKVGGTSREENLRPLLVQYFLSKGRKKISKWCTFLVHTTHST